MVQMQASGPLEKCSGKHDISLVTIRKGYRYELKYYLPLQKCHQWPSSAAANTVSIVRFMGMYLVDAYFPHDLVLAHLGIERFAVETQ